MAEVLIPRYQGRKLKGDRLVAFLDDLRRLLNKKILTPTLRESVRATVGARLTVEVIDQLCWRLAGNELWLLKRPVLPWRQQNYLEWVPIQITRAWPKRAGRKGMERGHDMEFRVLAGGPAGLMIRQWWSLRKSSFMARFRDDHNYSFGFSRRPRDTSFNLPPHLFVDARQFVTLRCLALIDPALSTDGPDFHTIAFTASLAEWNAVQQRYRARRSAKYTCPEGFPLSDPCHLCPIGLDQCRAAVHARTFEEKVCISCEKLSWHDPDDKVHKVCVTCAYRAELEHEKEQPQ